MRSYGISCFVICITCSVALRFQESTPISAEIAGEASNVKVWFTSYAYGHPFLETQQMLIDSIKSKKIDEKGDVYRIVSWSRASFEKAFANETVTGYKDDTLYSMSGTSYLKELDTRARKLNFRKDSYMWMWKPFIIRHALNEMQSGDMLVYQDASRYTQKGFEAPLRPLLDSLRSSDGVAGTCLPYTLREEWERYGGHAATSSPMPLDKFDRLVCGGQQAGGSSTCQSNTTADTNNMHQGSWLVLVKTERAMAFVNKWLELMYSLDVALTVPFQDQDAMTIAALQTGVPCAWLPVKNGFPNYKNGNDVKHMNTFLKNHDRFELLEPNELRS